MNVKFEESYSKALRLSNVEHVLEEGEDYQSYIEKLVAYTKVPSETIKEKLGVEEVIPMGYYVRGLFGGEKKKGAKRYAGLIFDTVGEYDITAGQYSIRLSGTNTLVKIPKYFLEPYWKKLVYRGEVFPFYLNGVYNVLLSSDGIENLREFLRIRILKNVLEEDRQRVTLLIEELQQPEKLMPLEKNKSYVVYRCTRNFASFVLSSADLEEISHNGTYGVVIESHCSFMSSDNEVKAYYYSAILNYLACKVIESKGAFERDQFLRPLMAILHAGLEWNEEKWQLKVAELGKKLHREAPKCFAGFIKRAMRVGECFEKLKICPETRGIFEILVKIVNENVDKKRFHESLELVCKLKRP